MRLSRRHALLAGLAYGCVPALPVAYAFSKRVPHSPDVVVIGAGAAGLAAARTLIRNGRSVAVIEASDRIGGRAFTDTQIFGVPYDKGAHWLHNGDHNPFKAYGERPGSGFRIYQSPETSMIYEGSNRLCNGDCDDFDLKQEAAEESIWEGRHIDQPASNVVDTRGEWGKTVAFAIGPWEMAKQLDAFSTRDWSCSAEGPNFVCAEGYGALLAHSGRDIPVQFSTKATEVRQTSSGVEVDTSQGRLQARACIVTVSNGVLHSGQIEFSPRLPDAKYMAFEKIAMGLYNRIALRFDSNIFGGESDMFAFMKLDSAVPGPARSIGFTVDIAGTGLIYGDVGGDLARDLEAAAPGDSIDYALQHLRAMLGTATVDNHYLGRADVTRWGRDRLTLGSYASAQPGYFDLRRELRSPVNDRIFFAGEACHLDQWATVAGAHLSGCETAQNVARLLDGLPLPAAGTCAEILEEEADTPPAEATAETGEPDCHDLLAAE